MNLRRWLTNPILFTLPTFASRIPAGVGVCTVTPVVVAMETQYTISASGLRPTRLTA
jgi:hypothetical protein